MRPALLLTLALTGCWREASYVVPTETLRKLAAMPSHAEDEVAVAATRVSDGESVRVGAQYIDRASASTATLPPGTAMVEARAVDPRRATGVALLVDGAASLVAGIGYSIYDGRSCCDDQGIMMLIVATPLFITAVVKLIAGTILVATGIKRPQEVPSGRAGWSYWR